MAGFSHKFDDIEIEAGEHGLTPGHVSGWADIGFDSSGDWWIDSVEVDAYFDDDGCDAPHDITKPLDRSSPLGAAIFAALEADPTGEIVEAVVEAADEMSDRRAYRALTRTYAQEHGTW